MQAFKISEGSGLNIPKDVNIAPWSVELGTGDA